MTHNLPNKISIFVNTLFAVEHMDLPRARIHYYHISYPEAHRAFKASESPYAFVPFVGKDWALTLLFAHISIVTAPEKHSNLNKQNIKIILRC